MSRARTFADLATASEAGSLTSPNIIINGDMSVAQRGTSSTSTNIATVDRWGISFGQVSVTQTQQSLTSGSPYESGFNNFYRAANTSVSSSTTSYIQFYQNIEAQHIANSGWNFKSSSSFVTLSFWARSSLQGTYYANVVTNDGTAYYRSTAFALSADTWTKVTFTIEGNSNLTINDDNGQGLQVNIVPHYGTGYTGSNASTTTWYTLVSNDYFPDYAQNWSNTSSATFDVTGVQLELGQVATPYKHESFGDNLDRCQRYFFAPKAKGDATAAYFGQGLYYNSSQMQVYIPHPVQMRTAPSVTVSDGSNHFAMFRENAGDYVDTLPLNSNTDTFTGLYNSDDASGNAGHSGGVLANNQNDSFIHFSAEL